MHKKNIMKKASAFEPMLLYVLTIIIKSKKK